MNFGNNPLYFADFGADFYSLKRSCTPTLVSTDSPFASTFLNRQWIFSVYNDGSTIHALIHNEFHDPIATTCSPGDSTDGNPCQYTSITYASSTDNGHTFTTPPSPANVIAAPPAQWTPPASTTLPFYPNFYYGYQAPTNIISTGGYYYSAFYAFPPPGQSAFGGLCFMRTTTLSDPSSWRAWNGTSFTLQMTDPYTGTPAAMCAGNSQYLPQDSLTFNSYLNMYMLMGLDSQPSGGTFINCGFNFSVSSDLVTWAAQQFIAPAYVSEPPVCEKPGAGLLAGSYAYASIIDPDDTTPNFETPGRTAYIYFTRFNDNISDRDLVRVPVMFTKY